MGNAAVYASGKPMQAPPKRKAKKKKKAPQGYTTIAQRLLQA